MKSTQVREAPTENLTFRELNIVTAIERTRAPERDREVWVLLGAMKESHQLAHGQLAALDRLRAPEHAPGAPIAVAPKIDVAVPGLHGKTIGLRDLRLVERHLGELYAEARHANGGLEREVYTRLADGAKRRVCLLTAHICRMNGCGDLENELPQPLAAYFATAQHRTCMRCLLDRSGRHPELVREDPHTYVCAACHDETLESFPPDLAAVKERWPQAEREARVIQRALTSASKQTACDRVHTVLAGQPPRERAPRSHEWVRPTMGPGQPVDGAPTSLHRASDDATPSERSYDDILFDYHSLRAWW